MTRKKKMKIKTKKVTDPTKISRGSWGTCNPVTRVHKDKSKYSRKQKHKNKEY